MTGTRRLPSSAARRRLLSSWGHDIKSLLHGQVLGARQLQEGTKAPEPAALRQLSESMEQLAFETWMFVEAAYSCVGQPNETRVIDLDDLLRRATAPMNDLVTLEASKIVVEASDYAVARTAHEMVLLLTRTRVARHVNVTASLTRNRLTIEAVAGNGPVQPSARRLREKLASTFSALHALAGVVVSVNRNGRGLKAVFEVEQPDSARPQVLVVSRDVAIGRAVTRACRGAGVVVKAWTSSLPFLVALQEATAATQVAACVIDAGLSDDCSDRLHHAVGRDEFRDRVVVVNEDRAADPPTSLGRAGRVVDGGGLAAAIRETLSRTERYAATR